MAGLINDFLAFVRILLFCAFVRTELLFISFLLRNMANFPTGQWASANTLVPREEPTFVGPLEICCLFFSLGLNLSLLYLREQNVISTSG